MKQIEDFKYITERMLEILDLSGSPVGIKFLKEGQKAPIGALILEKHRYCQAIMKARDGENVILNKEGISCPAAAAFGFRPLPEALKSGSGLIGFGIVSDASVGKKMFQDMSRLEIGQIEQLHLFPLDKYSHIPDVIIVEDEPEKLMWIALAYLHVTCGKRIESSTAILQATCVDSTIIPFLEQRLNLVSGCYGCRDATDLGENEAVMGFPAKMLPAIVEHLEFLNKNAIPHSRSKRALSALKNKNSPIKNCSTV
jgi:uncharacterized protein (DUF169 family)